MAERRLVGLLVCYGQCRSIESPLNTSTVDSLNPMAMAVRART